MDSYFSSADYFTQKSPSSEKQYTGTTLVAMECKDGVVVATDSLGTLGSFISSRSTDKITKFNDYIVILRAGAVADTQALADIVMYYAEANSIMDEEDEVSVRKVANYARKMSYNYRGQLDGSFLVAGYDSINKGQVYVIPNGGYTTRQPYYASGSGGTFIREFIQAQWKEGLDGEVVREILKKAVFEALRRDGGSGGLIHTAIIDMNGISRKTYRPDREDYPLALPEKFYPNLPEHVPQHGLPSIEAESMET